MPDPAHGWPTLCLASKDLAVSQAWCTDLGFRQVGNAAQGWVVMACGTVELALMGFLAADMVNMRGGDVPAIAKWLVSQGLSPFHVPGHDPSADTRVPGPRIFDPAGWPDDWLNDDQGNPLPVEGSGDCLVDDPDGNRIYFDSVPKERARFEAGEPFAGEGVDGSQLPGFPAIGKLRLRRPTADLAASIRFHERLGLTLTRQENERAWMDGPFRVQLGAGLTPALLFEGSARKGEQTDPDGRSWVFLQG